LRQDERRDLFRPQPSGNQPGLDLRADGADDAPVDLLVDLYRIVQIQLGGTDRTAIEVIGNRVEADGTDVHTISRWYDDHRRCPPQPTIGPSSRKIRCSDG